MVINKKYNAIKVALPFAHIAGLCFHTPHHSSSLPSVEQMDDGVVIETFLPPAFPSTPPAVNSHKLHLQHRNQPSCTRETKPNEVFDANFSSRAERTPSLGWEMKESEFFLMRSNCQRFWDWQIYIFFTNFTVFVLWWQIALCLSCYTGWSGKI